MEGELTFKDIYKPPFKRSMNGLYVQSDNHVTTFIVGSENADVHLNKIVEILNGNKFADKYDKNDVSVVDHTKIVIDMKYAKQKEVILVRGWGALIGSGGFNLDPKVSAKIQDDFIQWVVDSITEEKEEGMGCVVYGSPFPTA